MYKNSFVHYLTKILIDFMFYLGIIVCLAIPIVLPYIARLNNISTQQSMPYVIILLLLGLCSLYILWQLKAIFKTLLGGNPFIESNVKCLRKCAVASILIALIILVDMIMSFSIASAFAFVLFGLLGLFCLTLKDVFKQAIAYKEENDWTV